MWSSENLAYSLGTKLTLDKDKEWDFQGSIPTLISLKVCYYGQINWWLHEVLHKVPFYQVIEVRRKLVLVNLRHRNWLFDIIVSNLPVRGPWADVLK